MSVAQGGLGFPLLTQIMYQYVSTGEMPFVYEESDDENLPLKQWVSTNPSAKTQNNTINWTSQYNNHQRTRRNNECYMAASIIYNNAQRPGVVRHMKISEFEHRECMDDKIAIRVLNHKTSARGPAMLVII